MQVICDNLLIPTRLHQVDREPNQEFERNELLYRRFKVREPFDEWLNNNRISAAIFPVDRKGDSLNRDLYCESYKDVLYNIEVDGVDISYYGVVGFSCKEVFDCPCFTDELGNVYDIRLQHEPEPCMYPHSVIKVYKNGQYDSAVKSRTANANFRDVLISTLTLYKPYSF